jgi:hypothetical protein
LASYWFFLCKTGRIVPRNKDIFGRQRSKGSRFEASLGKKLARPISTDGLAQWYMHVIPTLGGKHKQEDSGWGLLGIK